MSDLEFTHLDPLGRARMVDVTPKEPTHRRAVARCKVTMKPETTTAIANRYRICQAYLGAKIHDPKDPGADLSAMLNQVVGSFGSWIFAPR